ncbi:MAG: hypothetical protein IJ618_07395 [Prevotella sp.]|nr:hypothetical protein [Prevotella sp.]
MEYRTIKVLNSGLPRWLIEAAFIIMVLSAVCSWHDFQLWFNAHCPIALALVQNVGMIIMYFAVMKGMALLPHPLTALWWTAIALCVAGFITVSMGPAYALYNFYVASLLSLVALPLGTLLIIWHQNCLRAVGIWMIVRILFFTLLPVLLYAVLNVETNSTFDLIYEVACLFIECTYAWLLRRTLIP